MRKRKRRITRVACVWLLTQLAVAGAAFAQSSAAERRASAPDQRDAGQLGGEKKRLPPPPQEPNPWSIFTTLSNGFASNIHFDLEDRDAFGVVLGTGVRFEGDDFELTYEIAGHSYTNTNRWNRVSHLVAASFEQDLTDKWTFEPEAQIGFKGSSEDRDIVDQDLEITPRFEYQFSPERRLRLFTTHRMKRYNDDPDSNAFKNYVGAEFRETMRVGRYWEFGGRYETNDEPLDRGDYRRFTYWLEHGLQLTAQDALVVQVRYRLKRYTAREVEVEDQDVLRVDHRWVPSVSWVRSLSPKLDVRADYTYETNYSNDFEREYGAHLAWTGVVIRWR